MQKNMFIKFKYQALLLQHHKNSSINFPISQQILATNCCFVGCWIFNTIKVLIIQYTILPQLYCNLMLYPKTLITFFSYIVRVRMSGYLL